MCGITTRLVLRERERHEDIREQSGSCVVEELEKPLGEVRLGCELTDICVQYLTTGNKTSLYLQ